MKTDRPAQAFMQTAHARKVSFAGFLLRVVAIILCVAAVVAMMTSRQHKTIEVPLPTGTFSSNIGVIQTVDYGYSRAFVYIVTATSIAGAYALLQAASSVTSMYLAAKAGGKSKAWLTFLADKMITYLLLAASAAATEVVYVGEKGSRTASWLAMCVILGKFCKHVLASIIFTYLATGLFSISSIVSAYELFGKYT
ncbi:hypothetical protein O6H91_06G031800 [Diphasiastrum complanatum]|uniref:Uncharacterized protein n=2 Tax=Diphasiastrum complanatum TaxID=34168 RepID=A0ACC2DC47_DIPCM|nr:hypothetical protein O6H91_06G029400 [Diphasiastrum complanatum]KAJ7551848.1 hypothetical protein O6H91_06G031800 [Diphasiastrum complanatum]